MANCKKNCNEKSGNTKSQAISKRQAEYNKTLTIIYSVACSYDGNYLHENFSDLKQFISENEKFFKKGLANVNINKWCRILYAKCCVSSGMKPVEFMDLISSGFESSDVPFTADYFNNLTDKVELEMKQDYCRKMMKVIYKTACDYSIKHIPNIEEGTVEKTSIMCDDSHFPNFKMYYSCYESYFRHGNIDNGLQQAIESAAVICSATKTGNLFAENLRNNFAMNNLAYKEEYFATVDNAVMQYQIRNDWGKSLVNFTTEQLVSITHGLFSIADYKELKECHKAPFLKDKVENLLIAANRYPEGICEGILTSDMLPNDGSYQKLREYAVMKEQQRFQKQNTTYQINSGINSHDLPDVRTQNIVQQGYGQNSNPCVNQNYYPRDNREMYGNNYSNNGFPQQCNPQQPCYNYPQNNPNQHFPAPPQKQFRGNLSNNSNQEQNRQFFNGYYNNGYPNDGFER